MKFEVTSNCWRTRIVVFAAMISLGVCSIRSASAETPSGAYVFPAGGQVGTKVSVRIGAHFFHDRADFVIRGRGVEGRSPIQRQETIWREGPILLLPASQQKEDYPKDYAGEITIAADAVPGTRMWHGITSQGVSPGLPFVLGTLPEVIEDEIGEPKNTEADRSKWLRSGSTVSLPVTINGRIFPREDVDVWSFDAQAGQVVTCEVNAARLGSGLDSRLEVLDPQGRVIAENSDAFGADSFVRFTAPESGKYSVRIHDIRFDGLQHFVYRLTISSGAWLDQVFPLGGRRSSTVPLRLFGANLPSDRSEFVIPAIDGAVGVLELRGLSLANFGHTSVNRTKFETDDLPEHIEPETAPASGANKIELPCVVNGRIGQPNEFDLWTFAGKKGDVWQFDLRASRLGSELDGVLTLVDDKGNTIATADDLGNGQTDAVLNATLPADGEFTLKVQDRISSRGGPAYAYRVRITNPKLSVLKLLVALDAISLVRGGESRIKVLADRPAGFADEVPLEVEGLPEGVTVTGNVLGKGQNQVDIVLKADAAAKLAVSPLRIVGKWKSGDTDQKVVAVIAPPPNDSKVIETDLSDILLRVSLATPFKVKGIFETKYVSRGSVFVRRFRIERNGFTGPMWAEVADRQARHLQGVTGPRIEIGADVSEFDYPFTLPPWMEIGRTSRSCIAVFGEIVEADGTRHVVSHTSQNQDDQAIVIVEPNRLSLESSRKSIRWQAGGEVRIPVQVRRAANLPGVVKVESKIGQNLRGLQIDPIQILDGSNQGEILVRFDGDMPISETDSIPKQIKLQATMLDERGLPLADELSLDLVR